MLSIKDAFEKAEALIKESGEVAERMQSEISPSADEDGATIDPPEPEVVVVPEPEGVQ